MAAKELAAVSLKQRLHEACPCRRFVVIENAASEMAELRTHDGTEGDPQDYWAGAVYAMKQMAQCEKKCSCYEEGRDLTCDWPGHTRRETAEECTKIALECVGEGVYLSIQTAEAIVEAIRARFGGEGEK